MILPTIQLTTVVALFTSDVINAWHYPDEMTRYINLQQKYSISINEIRNEVCFTAIQFLFVQTPLEQFTLFCKPLRRVQNLKEKNPKPVNKCRYKHRQSLFISHHLLSMTGLHVRCNYMNEYIYRCSNVNKNSIERKQQFSVHINARAEIHFFLNGVRAPMVGHAYAFRRGEYLHVFAPF